MLCKLKCLYDSFVLTCLSIEERPMGRPPKADRVSGTDRKISVKAKASQRRRQEMIEDKATEKLKKRLQKWGLIVNAGVDKPESRPKSEDKKKSVKNKGRK